MPKRLTEEERSSLSWELSRLYGAGLSWPDSVALLVGQKSSAALTETLQDLGKALNEGADLAGAMAGTGCFPPEYLRQVELGQVSGRLEQVLSALADYDRREGETHAALRRAVTYPLTMIALIGAIFFFLAWRILPVFSRAFTQMGVTGVSEGGRLILMGLSVTCSAAALLLLGWFRRGGGLKFFGRGKVGLAAARARFASAMALMLQSGMALDESAERCAALLEGGPLSDPMGRCRTAMERGEEFPKAVEAAGLLDSFQSGLLAAGFRSGDFAGTLKEISNRCSRQAEERLEYNLGRFEYGLVLFLCAAVAALLLTVMLPLAQMLTALGG